MKNLLLNFYIKFYYLINYIEIITFITLYYLGV